jgi:hypothetical protein
MAIPGKCHEGVGNQEKNNGTHDVSRIKKDIKIDDRSKIIPLEASIGGITITIVYLFNNV